MKKKEKVLLSEVLRQIDASGSLQNHLNPYRHHVCYSHSRTIIRYLKSDVVLTAYAYNPGNALVIFPKQDGLLAYGCYLDSFPVSNGYPSYHWGKLQVEAAIHLIKQDIWQKSGYDENTRYYSTGRGWQKLASGIIEFTSFHCNSTYTIEQFRANYDNYVYEAKYTILRLKSGRLRVEVNDQYFAFTNFLEIVLCFQDKAASAKASICNLPAMGNWRKALGVEQPPEKLIRELKAQVIAKKMQEAA
jgi:hypothetical protein